MVSKIRKRDGRIADFDQAKIASAITRAGRETGSGDELLSEELASVITLFLEKTCGQGIPSVGDVRDVVERILMETGHPDAARAFILHSERRKKRRDALSVLDVEGGADEDRGLEVDHASRGAISPLDPGYQKQYDRANGEHPGLRRPQRHVAEPAPSRPG